jgi:hypothetical protein
MATGSTWVKGRAHLRDQGPIGPLREEPAALQPGAGQEPVEMRSGEGVPRPQRCCGLWPRSLAGKGRHDKTQLQLGQFIVRVTKGRAFHVDHGRPVTGQKGVVQFQVGMNGLLADPVPPPPARRWCPATGPAPRPAPAVAVQSWPSAASGQDRTCWSPENRCPKLASVRHQGPWDCLA